MTPPEPFNIAERVCRRHDDAVYRIALEDMKIAGFNTYTFGGLDFLSDKFAVILNHCNIKSGDVIATVLPQGAAFAISHLAVLKTGAVVTPISIGTEQAEIEGLIEASGAKIVVVNETIYQRFTGLAQRVPQVEQVFVACDYTSRNDFGEGFRSFWYEVTFADSYFIIANTDKTTPAYLFCQRDGESWQKRILTHGEIAESCSKSALNVADEQTIFWTANSWSSARVLSEMLYPAWFQGYPVASYEAADKDIEVAVRYLGEKGLESIKVYSES